MIEFINLIEQIEQAEQEAEKALRAGGEQRQKARMALRSVSAKSLHARALRLADRKLDRATLFPFFDGTGQTRWLLLAMEQPPRVILLEWRPGLVQKPLFGATRLDLAWSVLDDATSELAEKVSAYWHFDPWWLLTQPSLASHPASSPLLVTNAVEALEGVTGLHYSSDLSRVVWQSSSAEDGSLKLYDPNQLPVSPVPPSAAGVRNRGVGWQLRPFWER